MTSVMIILISIPHIITRLIMKRALILNELSQVWGYTCLGINKMRRRKMKLMVVIMFFLMVRGIAAGGDTGKSDQEGSKARNTEKVQISPQVLIIPLGRIVLVRKDSRYCAVKFTEAWSGETEFDNFAKYESYYQGDGTGDFWKDNVQIDKALLAARRRVGLGRLLTFPAGPENTQIKCGPVKLAWSGWGSVYFNDRTWNHGDHGIELAPTKWTNSLR